MEPKKLAKVTRQRGSIQHIQINVTDLIKSKQFYDDFLGWIGYKRIMDEKDIVGWNNGEVQIFLVECESGQRGHSFHRKRVGLNHIAFRARSREDIDTFFRDFLTRRGIAVLYGGPREYPEYSPSYFAVYFEDPDRIKLELMHA